MKTHKLTPESGDATDGGTIFRGANMDRKVLDKGAQAAIIAAGFVGLGGCINVAAPEEPIVIELNVNIRAEVLYRLAEDASNTIDENADIF